MDRRAFLCIAAGALATTAFAQPDNIRLFHQEHALSCEAAALRMALALRGVDVTEDDILARLTYDPTPRQVQPDGSVIWGDPDLGFVGAIDGVFARDGYGVYDGPIADVAVSFGLTNTSHARSVDPHDLYMAVTQAVPVVAWIPYDLTVRGRGQWSTPAGNVVDYVVTEHCVLLTDVTPNGVVYADPWDAALKSADYATFESGFAEIGNRAVFVSA